LSFADSAGQTDPAQSSSDKSRDPRTSPRRPFRRNLGSILNGRLWFPFSLVDQTKGVIKDVVGKASGDTKLQAEGAEDKLTGKVESAIGDTNATVGDMAGKPIK
jgi:uncharacterized protein YjbJ (UPF0337 family)